MARPRNLMTLRKLRQNPFVRELTQEIQLSANQFIQPLFVVEGLGSKAPVPALTGVFRETSESLLKQVEADLEKGIRKFLLFGVPQSKKTKGFDFTFTTEQIKALKKNFGSDIWLAVDVCLCSYTDHGHCGILENPHTVQNDSTVAELARAALHYAEAGADCVAPSDMMDGRIAAIRDTLSEQGLLEKTIIMSYSAKFSSRFYGPFREAADSAPKGDVQLKDRATYQIDPSRPTDAYLSSLRDAKEGADILMVKPAMPYLDVLKTLSTKIRLPWAVYEVSGEYAAIELLAAQNLMDGPKAHVEAWTAMKRAGASIIISYGARHAPKWIPK